MTIGAHDDFAFASGGGPAAIICTPHIWHVFGPLRSSTPVTNVPSIPRPLNSRTRALDSRRRTTWLCWECYERHHRRMQQSAIRATDHEPVAAPMVPASAIRWLKDAW